MSVRESLIKAARYAAEISNNNEALKKLRPEWCARLSDDELLDLTCTINRQMSSHINDMITEQTDTLRRMQ